MSSGCWTRRQALIGAAAGCGLLAWPGCHLAAQAPGGSIEPGGAEPRQDAVAFPLAKAPDGSHLVDANGRAFLLHGDTAWSLIADVSAEDARLYLEDRRRRGFNTILVNLIENRFSRKAPRNFYDAPPFSVPGDFAAPSEAYFAHADRILEDAARLGLLVVLTPAYLGYKGGREGWYRAMRESGPETLRAYGDFLGRRYARFDNIVWLHGGDFNPPDRTLSAVIAEAIRKQAPRALHSAHCAPGTVRQGHHAAHHLVGVPGVDTEIHRDFDRLVKFGVGPFLDHLDGLIQGIKLHAVNPLPSNLHAFC